MTEQNKNLLNTLSHVSLFSDLSPEMLKKLISATSVINLKKGETLIKQGDAADQLYIVLQGKFSVFAKTKMIAEIGIGEPVGELAFFTGNTRNADVIAARGSKVLSLTRSAYNDVSKNMPDLANSILAALSRRLVKATHSSAALRPQAGHIVTVIPAAKSTLPAALTQALSTEFTALSEWKVISQTDIPGGNADTLQAWLLKQEAEHGNLLLICSDPITAPDWFSAAAGNSDSTFIFAPLDDQEIGGTALSSAEEVVWQANVDLNLHLVLYRDQKTDKIKGTEKWLDERPICVHHHHIAFDDKHDFERLSRFMRGKAIGLILSGGGAFGAAHLGAIKAMQERGFVFDMVGGTSIGAAMAAVLGMEMDPREAIDICQNIFVKNKAMGRFTFPLYSVIDHHRLDGQLKKHYGAFDVEDMPVAFFAVTANLSNNDIAIRRRGPLWQAVRASCSLPGILPPVVTDEGEVLIDGGLLDNVPISHMRHLKAGPNIIFNFDHSGEWRVRAKYDALPGRWGALARLIGLKKVTKPRFPNIFSVLSRAMVVSARRLMENTDISGDVMIELRTLRGMGFLEWKKARRQFDAAYNQMVETMDALDIKQAAFDDDANMRQFEQIAHHISGKNNAP